MSASYASRMGVITAYVYPARPPYSPALSSHFAECEKEIRASWGSVKRISKRATSIKRHGREYPGFEELFSGVVPNSEQVGSWLVVFKRGDYYVKFRFTFPRAAMSRAPGELKAFLDQLPWPR